MRIVELLENAARRVHLHAIRMHLETPDVQATVPMLRGVWGAKLKTLAPVLYEAVFEATSTSVSLPRYIFRPASPAVLPRPAVEWLLINVAFHDLPVLVRAWDDALATGLGKKRVPAQTLYRLPLGPGGEVDPSAHDGFTLDRAAWPLPPDVPCRLCFVSPLRIYRQKRLIRQPTLHDLAVAALRRLEQFLPEERAAALHERREDFLAMCDDIPVARWRGDKQDFVRWSSRQQMEVVQEGVIGDLVLPEGPGSLAPLLAIGQWLHLGKGTVMGLGQFVVEPCYR